MMMDKIYAQASAVLVWLFNYESPELLDDISLRSQDQERHYTEFPSSFLTLSKSNWWFRAWTFQEAALAKTLIFYIGYRRFSLEDLTGYSDSLYRHLFQPGHCCDAKLFAEGSADEFSKNKLYLIGSMIQDLSSNRRIISQGEKSLLDLILDNRDRQATKPQDKVYAYMGLAYDVPTELVKYELSLREWNVHISTKFIQHDKSLKIVRFASLSGFIYLDGQRMDGLPSWSPDWTQFVENRISLMIRARYGQLDTRKFTASGRTAANFRFPTRDILGVSGIVCDTVTHLGQATSYSSAQDDSLEILRQWCRFLAASPSIHDAKCNQCDKVIYGIRKKCIACPDFDLCSKCFYKSGDVHPNHSFISIQSSIWESHSNGSNEGLYKFSDNVTKYTSSGWERLDKIAYPFSDGDTLQDAFRKVLATELDLHLLFGQSCHGIDYESRKANILLKTVFARFWHLKVERRPEADFIISEDNAMEIRSIAPKAQIEEGIGLVDSIVRAKIAWTRLFVSSKGYIGWGPKEMRVGDTISVLHGNDMPTILRAVPEKLSKTNTGSGYTVIGDCFVPGLMRGEALENEEMEKRDFLLY